MSEPIFGESTERVYSRLPEHFRLYDQGFVLKRFLSGLLARQDGVSSLITRFTYTSPEEGDGQRSSALVDPSLANPEWLPWIAQLFGVKTISTTVSAENQSTIFNAGTIEAIETAIKQFLIGDKFVSVHPWTKPTGVGTVWDMTIKTRTAETLKNILPEHFATAIDGTLLSARYTLSDDSVVSADKTGELFAGTVADGSFYGGNVFSIGRDATVNEPYPVAFIVETTPVQLSVGPGDPFHFFFAAKSFYDEEGTITATLQFHDAAGAITSSVAKTFDMTPDKALFAIDVAAFPTAARVSLLVSSVVPMKIGEFGARLEPDVGWVPRTVDPVQIAIDSNVKPAGVVLHYATHSSSWNTFEANYPTFDAVEAAGSWDNIEATGA